MSLAPRPLRVSFPARPKRACEFAVTVQPVVAASAHGDRIVDVGHSENFDRPQGISAGAAAEEVDQNIAGVSDRTKGEVADHAFPDVGVTSALAVDEVISSAAPQHVVTTATKDRVISAATPQVVGENRPANRVVRGGAVEVQRYQATKERGDVHADPLGGERRRRLRRRQARP